MWTIQPVPPRHYDKALALLANSIAGMSAEATVAALRNYFVNLGGREQDFWWATQQDRVLAAAMLIRSSGRTGIILHSSADESQQIDQPLADLLRRLAGKTLGPGLILVQSLVSPQAEADIRTLKTAGFWLLAELIYMRCNLWRQPVILQEHSVVALSFEPLTDRNRDVFAAAIVASYQDSLDCPQLEGLRSIEDVLAGHEASGIFRPDLWTLALIDEKPAGVLLLNETPNEQSLEVVYMGVAKEFRGRHLGRILLDRARQQAGVQDFQDLLLAVDSRNTFACKLYENAGFIEYQRRFAYVRTIRDEGV